MKVLAKARHRTTRRSSCSRSSAPSPACTRCFPRRSSISDDDHEKLFDVAELGEASRRGRRSWPRARSFIRDLDAGDRPASGSSTSPASNQRHSVADPRSSRRASSRTSRRSTATAGCLHELGLLEGVTTYWVDERSTATSPRTRDVLDAITELLQTGETAVLADREAGEARRPARGLTRLGERRRRRAGGAGGRRDPRHGEARAPARGAPAGPHARGADPAREPRLRGVPRHRWPSARDGRGEASSRTRACPRSASPTRRRPPHAEARASRSSGAT